ncbi:MAG TPA: homoserine dehydrogenase [Candidatus Methylacidiphilales bacterium]|nr:homoserine dehydrogenase [Candidatus Methylacidiphilales bacterium]
MNTTPPILRVGLAGLGTVGSSVWRRLVSQKDLLRQRTGTEIRVDQVAARRLERARECAVPEEIVTPDWRKLAANPELDVMVELIGGATEAFELIRTALQNGKHVVTANKALLAERGGELFQLAIKHQRHLLFEASVAGGIPIIRALREGLVANRIISIHGIINGTCNYILTRMNEAGLEFKDALAEAKREGYAEADDSLDVDGHDTAHKAAVLAALAYGFWTPPDRLYTEGLRAVEKQDIVYARKLGYALKLLAIIRMDPDGAAEVRVHPALIPLSHVLASVSGVFNAVLVRGDVVGDTLYYGRGAGGDPTASAVLSDLAQIASHFPQEQKARNVGHEALHSRLKTMDEIVSRYYLRLMVEDRPGVLADVARVLASRQIGISSVIQPEAHAGETTPLVVMLHDAPEAQFRAAVAEIAKIPTVKAPPVSLRVEDFI